MSWWRNFNILCAQTVIPSNTRQQHDNACQALLLGSRHACLEMNLFSNSCNTQLQQQHQKMWHKSCPSKALALVAGLEHDDHRCPFRPYTRVSMSIAAPQMMRHLAHLLAIMLPCLKPSAGDDVVQKGGPRTTRSLCTLWMMWRGPSCWCLPRRPTIMCVSPTCVGLLFSVIRLKVLASCMMLCKNLSDMASLV